MYVVCTALVGCTQQQSDLLAGVTMLHELVWSKMVGRSMGCLTLLLEDCVLLLASHVCCASASCSECATEMLPVVLQFKLCLLSLKTPAGKGASMK